MVTLIFTLMTPFINRVHNTATGSNSSSVDFANSTAVDNSTVNRGGESFSIFAAMNIDLDLMAFIVALFLSLEYLIVLPILAYVQILRRRGQFDYRRLPHFKERLFSKSSVGHCVYDFEEYSSMLSKTPEEGEIQQVNDPERAPLVYDGHLYDRIEWVKPKGHLKTRQVGDNEYIRIARVQTPSDSTCLEREGCDEEAATAPVQTPSDSTSLEREGCDEEAATASSSPRRDDHMVNIVHLTDGRSFVNPAGYYYDEMCQDPMLLAELTKGDPHGVWDRHDAAALHDDDWMLAADNLLEIGQVRFDQRAFLKSLRPSLSALCMPLAAVQKHQATEQSKTVSRLHKAMEASDAAFERSTGVVNSKYVFENGHAIDVLWKVYQDGYSFWKLGVRLFKMCLLCWRKSLLLVPLFALSSSLILFLPFTDDAF